MSFLRPLTYFLLMPDQPVPSPVTAPSSRHWTSFRQAFDAWLADQQNAGVLRRPGAHEVYQAMWDSFATWCLSQSPPVTIRNLHLQDLQAFQAARYGRKSSDQSLSPRYALRLSRLIERVLGHHASRTASRPNRAPGDWIRANPTVRYAEAGREDPPPEVLSPAEARQLVAYLSEARPRPGRATAALDALPWQDLRNRASVALQLGAGLAPGDVRALTLASPVRNGVGPQARPWLLRVPANGTVRARETPIAPWAAELLHHWLEVRSAARIAGDFLFPSTRTGKPWLADSQYQCARKVLDAAGIGQRPGAGGSYRLRHTFAVRQLRRGTSPDLLARWLGVEPVEMKRYESPGPAPAPVI